MSFQYRKDVLANGLRVVTVRTPHLHTSMLAIYVGTGSRHETERTNGVSHFLEHMFFRGSHAYPDTVQMNAAVEEVGGNLNGVTARDHGYYFTPLHPNHLDVGMRILGDMLTRPRLTQMDVEREVILEEMLDELDERGRDIDVDNLSKMALFKGHPLSLKIAGTQASVRRLKHADLEQHLERFYVAKNLVVCAAGKIDRRWVLELAEECFGALRPGSPSVLGPPPRSRGGPWFSFVRREEAQTEVRISLPTVPEHHPDHAALQILRRVLDDGLSSRLPFNVVEKRGLAYSVHCGIETYDDIGLFEVEAASAPEKAPLVLEEIWRTLDELSDREVSASELRRAQRRHRMFLGFLQDSPGDLAGWFGGTELFRAPESFEERAKLVEAETAAHVRKVAKKYLRPANAGVVAVGSRRGLRALERAALRA